MKKIFILLSAMLSAFVSSSAQEPVPTYVEETPIMFDKPAYLGNNFENDVHFPKANFSTVKPNDKIRVLLSDVKAGAQIEIDFKFNNSGWTWTSYVPYTDLQSGATSFEFLIDDKIIDDKTVTATDFVDGLQLRDGMYVKGMLANVTGMQILTYDDGIDPYADYVAGEVIALDHVMSWSDYSVPEKNFSKVKVGDKIRLLFKEVGSDPQLQLAVKQDNKNWTWTEFLKSAVRGDKFEFDIQDYTYNKKEYSADLLLAGLKAHGLWLKGQASTLVGVQLLTHKDNIEYFMYGGRNMLDAPVNLGSWSGMVQFGKEYFGYIKPADYVTVFVDDVTKGAQLQFAGKKNLEADGWSTFIPYQDIIQDGYHEFYIKEYTTSENGAFTAQEVADALRVDGLWLKGAKASVTGMQNHYKIDPNDETVWTEVSKYEKDKELTSLTSGKMLLGGSTRFKSAKLGDKVVLAFSKIDDTVSNTQYRLCVYNTSIDVEITGAQNYENRNVEILIDSQYLLDILKKHGLSVYGTNIKFTGCYLYHPTQTGIEEVISGDNEEFDFNAPYEIYTVMGVRVSEMTPGNVYILRQGSKVLKMVR